MPLPIITIEGTVVADPELRYSATGMAVCSFRVAANQPKRNADDTGWVDDKVLFLPVAAFDKLAENSAESLEKGTRVVITGRLYTDEWETEGGEKRSMVKMNADSVSVSLRFRTVRHGEGQAQRQQGGERQQQQQQEDPWQRPPAADEPPF